MKRNKFSLSHYKLLTMNMGDLVPVGLIDVLPGDTIQMNTSALVRVAPLLAPVMHPVHVKIHHWFVPYRLIWENFEKFITGGPDGNDASVPPFVDAGSQPIGGLADYLGVPTGVASSKFSALPLRAYNLVWNEWYRDQDLQNEKLLSKADGDDTVTETALLSVNWGKDRFTTAKSDTQKGDEVLLPLGLRAPLISDASQAGTAGGTYVPTSIAAPTTHPEGVTFGNQIFADLRDASAASINDLREAFALQKFAEARQRYGSRYTEYLRYLGIRSSDSRLQRPEYLGGGRQTIQFSEVLQTGVDGTGAGVGNLAGHGISAMRSNRFRRFFEEHGFIISLMSAVPKTIYSQGLPRFWSRETREDFYQRELEHIGMDEVKNKEVYMPHSSPDGVFGYQNRYDEYRRMESSVAGEFRPGGGLDHYHMARSFAGDVALNDSFLSANPTNRIYASTSTDQLYIMASHSIQARRLLSKTGNPGGF